MKTPQVNILLVDDDARNLDVLDIILESPDYRLVRAQNADEALRALNSENFAVMVLDIRMPDMSGLELAQMIKQRKKTQHMPIIFLTAYYKEDEHILQGYDAGAVDYLSKPCSPAILRSKIAVFAELYRKTRQLAEQNDAIVRANTEALAARQLAEEHARKAEAASGYKSNFLASMSHELRTPLNGIIGFTELLYDEKAGPVPPQQKECLGDVLNSARHLLQLINDVLDLAKVESGKMQLRSEVFPVRKAIEEVCSVVKGMAHKKHLRLDIDVSASLEAVTLDQQKFKQVLYNLLSNAVKFTRDGGRITVRARQLDQHLELCVHDTGIGIKAGDLQRIFVEFEQLDSGLSRRFEGSGLGLALTKKIVEFLGGQITVDSEPGQGSLFTVLLPVGPGKDRA